MAPKLSASYGLIHSSMDRVLPRTCWKACNTAFSVCKKTLRLSGVTLTS